VQTQSTHQAIAHGLGRIGIPLVWSKYMDTARSMGLWPLKGGLRRSLFEAVWASHFGILNCLLVLLLLASGPSAAIELDFAKTGSSTLNLNEYASWAEDKTGKLTFDQVRADTGPLTFQNVPGGAWSPDFGRSNSAFWVKLRILNSSNATSKPMLVMAKPLLDTVDVFFEAPDGSLRATKTGHALDFESRPYPHRLLIIPLELGAREGQTVWMRVQSRMGTDVSAQIWESATFQLAKGHDAMRYGWLGGLCAALGLVFAFLWGATGQKAFGLFLGLVLAVSWFVGENSGLLPALLAWSGHAAATLSHAVAGASVLFFTVALLYNALASPIQSSALGYMLRALAVFSLVIPCLLFWPALAAATLHYGLPIAYVLLLLATFGLALGGKRPFIWYCLALLIPAISIYLQHLSDMLSGGDLGIATYSLDRALVQGMLVFAGAAAFQEVRKRQAHMRELRTLLQEQNLALERGRQSEFDLEAQVSLRTQDLAMAARRLESLSSIDGMTGIANRRRFDETLPVEWGRAARDKRPLSVALIDVDWFKAYNDAYGHPAGDECLRQLARVFEAGVMRSGDLIARYGGEEFVLIAPDTDLNGINTIASYLCQEVFALGLDNTASPFGRISVSIGVATAYPHRGSKPALLVQEADAALYRAKHNGRHRVAGPIAENGKP